MDKKEFFKEFKKLCLYYNSDFYQKAEIISLYYEKVKNMSFKEFQNKCKYFMLNSVFMPKIAEFEEKTGTFHTSRNYNKEFLESFYDI